MAKGVRKAALKPIAAAKEQTANEKVVECFINHRDTNRKLIFDDYLVDDGLLDDLHDADDVFISELADLVLDSTPDQMLRFLVKEEHTQEMLEAIDFDLITEFVRERTPEYMTFKVTSRADQEKIKAFIEAEIYPSYNEQKEFLPWA